MMIRTLVVAAVAAVFFMGSARGDSRTEPHPWVLLGLDVHQGAVTERDTARDANAVSVYGEALPVYVTRADCQAVFARKGGCNAKEAVQAGTDCREAAAGWCFELPRVIKRFPAIS